MGQEESTAQLKHSLGSAFVTLNGPHICPDKTDILTVVETLYSAALSSKQSSFFIKFKKYYFSSLNFCSF